MVMKRIFKLLIEIEIEDEGRPGFATGEELTENISWSFERFSRRFAREIGVKIIKKQCEEIEARN